MQMNFAVSEADYLRADSLYRKLPPPRNDTMQWRTLHAFKSGDVSAQEASFAFYQKDTTVSAGNVGYKLLHDENKADAAVRFATLGLRGRGTRNLQQRNQIMMAAIEAERGQVSSAIDRMSQHAGNKARLFGMLAGVPLYQLTPAQIAAMRTEVAGGDSTYGTTTADSLRPHIRLYRLALLNCQARDYSAAMQQVARMRALSSPSFYRGTVEHMATEIEARIDVEENRPDAALRKLEQIRSLTAVDVGAQIGWGYGVPTWRAEALYRARRYKEAQQWFDNLDGVFIEVQPHVAYILLRRAQVADALNESDKARDLYARFLDMWKRPDAQLQPIVDQARNRLAALQAQAG